MVLYMDFIKLIELLLVILLLTSIIYLTVYDNRIQSLYIKYGLVIILVCILMYLLYDILINYNILQGGNKECVTAGCSGELCVPYNKRYMVTPCIWKCNYSCLKKYGDCGLVNGKCKWKASTKLDQCIKDCK
jgi:eight-cysteine-cluster-containing protein